MQYMLLINGDESIQPQSEEEHETLFQNFQKFTSDLRSSGAFVMGNPFAPPTSATTVRVRDGKYAVTDGPFAETKEYLGGFLIIEADSLDIALETAKAASKSKPLRRSREHRLRAMDCCSDSPPWTVARSDAV